MASLVGRFRNFPIPQRRQLVACGAAAGLASAYNAPIAGAFFVAEIVLGTVVVESLGPLILASVTATFLSRAFHGESPLYQSPALALHTRWEIVPLCAIGIFMGLLAPLYLRVLRRTERLFSKLALPVPAKLALGRGRGRVAGNVLSSGVWQWERTDDLSLPSELGFLHGSVSGDRQAYSYLGDLRIRCGRRCIYADTLVIGSAIGVLYGQAVLYFAPQLHPDRWVLFDSETASLTNAISANSGRLSQRKSRRTILINGLQSLAQKRNQLLPLV